MKIKIILIAMFLLLAQVAISLPGVASASVKGPLLELKKTSLPANASARVMENSQVITPQGGSVFTGGIIINHVSDPSTPTTFSGRVYSAGLNPTDFAVYIQNVFTGEFWNGSAWDNINYTEFPITINSDKTFSFDLSTVGFIQDNQYLLSVHGSDSLNDYLLADEVFSYGDTALLSIDRLEKYTQITGTSIEQPYVQLVDTNSFYCWNGTRWSSLVDDSACNLIPTYNDDTQLWTLNTSSVNFSSLSQYEIYAFGSISDIFDAKDFYYLPGFLVSITTNPTTLSIVANSTQQFTSTGLDQFGNVLTVQPIFSWVSSNPSIGTINSASGLFTAISAGTTTVTVNRGSVSKSVDVSVTPLAPSCVTGADTDNDSLISMTELLGYIGSWKMGNIPLDLLLSGIGFWKAGTGC